jgi:hypothetical protein
MERLIIIGALFFLNGAYWFALCKYWDRLSDDGAVGRSILGVVLLIPTMIIIFNLDYILNHHAQ